MLLFAWAVGRPWVKDVYESGATLVACLVAATLAVIYVRIEDGLIRAGPGIVLLMLSTIFIIRLRFRHFAGFSLVAWASFMAVVVATVRSQPALSVAYWPAVPGALLLRLDGAWPRAGANRREFRRLDEVPAAKARIEDLLHSMLPGEIGDRIQRGESPVADAHREVSIVFADLVGLTALSQ